MVTCSTRTVQRGRPWLLAGAAVFVLMLAVLVPAHQGHGHPCDRDGDSECGVCLHWHGNPVAVAAPPTLPLPTGALLSGTSDRADRPGGLPTTPRGRGPPLVHPEA